MYKKPNNTTNPGRYFGTWGKTYPCEQFDECDWERDNLNENDCRSLGNRGEGSRKRCHEKDNEECENTINIINKVCINQKASADGGDGGDAENGDATGGSASAAAASGLIAIAANVDNPDIKIPISDDLRRNEKGELETEQSNGTGTSAAATGGNATIGTSEGGRGGDGGTASNAATVSIENVVIISCNSDTPNGVSIGAGGRTLDIKVDENGDTFVNGEKMDEKKLSDGTKVLIFRNSHSE